jgi:hypothetical protein
MRGMAKSFLTRFLGLGLSLVAAASLLLTGFILLQTWRLQGRVITNIQTSLDIISSTLVTTSDGLTTIGQSLEAISDSLKSLQNAAISAGGSFHSQAASLQALSTLFSKDLPNAFMGAQTAMTGAQAGAKEVEDTLAVLTSNPAFAATPYNPPLLLSTALSGVANELGALPVPMQATGENLSTTSGNLTALEITVTDFAASLEQLRAKLGDASAVVERYQQELGRIGKRVNWLRAEVPKWVRWAALGLSFLLGWLVIIQLFTLGRGFHWMMRGE